MKNALKTLALVAAAAVVTACGGGNAGHDYVGTWVNVKTAANTLEIERQDSGFVVRETSSNWINGRAQTRTIPAKMTESGLQVNSPAGTTTLTVDKATGRLTNGRTEYQRAG